MKPLLHCFKDCWHETGRKMMNGAIRHSTILHLANAKGIDLKGAKTVEQVKQVVCTHQPSNLSKVLAAFNIFVPCIVGDKQALERIAYELCEDQAHNSVVYFEVRYSPHLLSNVTEHTNWTADQLNPVEVVEAVNVGLARGQKDFQVKCNSILCCIQGYPQYNKEVLDWVDFTADI
uniref:adenosine deaminase n=1 Tax=Ditylenchus dipsaci TaxID=166011 RepID=A0A915DN44_9BILA